MTQSAQEKKKAIFTALNQINSQFRPIGKKTVFDMQSDEAEFYILMLNSLHTSISSEDIQNNGFDLQILSDAKNLINRLETCVLGISSNPLKSDSLDKLKNALNAIIQKFQGKSIEQASTQAILKEMANASATASEPTLPKENAIQSLNKMKMSFSDELNQCTKGEKGPLNNRIHEFVKAKLRQIISQLYSNNTDGNLNVLIHAIENSLVGTAQRAKTRQWPDNLFQVVHLQRILGMIESFIQTNQNKLMLEHLTKALNKIQEPLSPPITLKKVKTDVDFAERDEKTESIKETPKLLNNQQRTVSAQDLTILDKSIGSIAETITRFAQSSAQFFYHPITGKATPVSPMIFSSQKPGQSSHT